MEEPTEFTEVSGKLLCGHVVVCTFTVRRLAGAGVATTSEAWCPRDVAGGPFFAAIQTLLIHACLMVSAPPVVTININMAVYRIDAPAGEFQGTPCTEMFDATSFLHRLEDHSARGGSIAKTSRPDPLHSTALFSFVPRSCFAGGMHGVVASTIVLAFLFLHSFWW